MKICVVVLLLAVIGGASELLEVWPGPVPGSSEAKAAHETRGEGAAMRIKKVTNPTLEVFHPSEEKRNGRAIIVCPGGGYVHLADDKEGTQVSKYYQSLGYTTFTLIYRVPKQRDGALQDVQRAIRYVRANAERYQIAKDAVGVLGFSAGGHLVVRAAMQTEASYTAVDQVDTESVVPSFVVAIYPAYLDQGEGKSLSPELTVRKGLPPVFMAVARDDFNFINGSLVLGQALGQVKVPYALHVFPQGGHGFGMLPHHRIGREWPGMAHTWMEELYK